MQQLIQTRKIMDDERKQIVLEVIADKYCKSILRNTLNKPKSAHQISQDAEIPISTVYRRLQTLFDAKLLAISGSINEDGKKYFLYQSRMKSISVKYDLDEAIVEIEPNLSLVR
jgi:predicted transcriptional regulator